MWIWYNHRGWSKFLMCITTFHFVISLSSSLSTVFSILIPLTSFSFFFKWVTIFHLCKHASVGKLSQKNWCYPCLETNCMGLMAGVNLTYLLCSFIVAESDVALEDVGTLVKIGLEFFEKSQNKLYAQVIHVFERKFLLYMLVIIFFSFFLNYSSICVD